MKSVEISEIRVKSTDFEIRTPFMGPPVSVSLLVIVYSYSGACMHLRLSVANYEKFDSGNEWLWIAIRQSFSRLGLRQLCQHNFEHNRYLKASSIMPA